MSEAPARLDARGRRGLVVGAILLGLLFATAFAAAGRLDWARGWAAVTVFTLGHAVNRLLLWRLNPELLNRRARATPGMRRWDRWIMLAVFTLPFAIAGVAGADAGRNAAAALPWWMFGVGLGLFGCGVYLGIWAMAVNAHFEKTVRIQHDRDHQVVDRGPYRLIRHPGYAAGLLVFGAAPLLLGSAWSALPTALFLSAIVYRTAREDRTLHEELDGYRDYARRVRARLLPGIW